MISNIFVINAFLDLVRNGKEKKIVLISSQSADVEFTRLSSFSNLLGYSAAKASMMVIVTKYGAELAPCGIKTLSLSPGWVNTDAGQSIPKAKRCRAQKTDSEQTAQAVTGNPEVRKFVLGLFHKLDPTVNGPAPVDEAVTNMLQVVQSLTEADSGKFLTHHGKNAFGDSSGNVDWF